MAYSKDEWELVSKLLLCGNTLGATAMVTGISANYISTMRNDPQSELGKLLTEGMETTSTSFAKANITTIAMTSESDKVRLAAAQHMYGWTGDTDTADDTTKSDAQLRLDIIKDLA